jgi:hypothetical protein
MIQPLQCLDSVDYQYNSAKQMSTLKSKMGDD